MKNILPELSRQLTDLNKENKIQLTTLEELMLRTADFHQQIQNMVPENGVKRKLTYSRQKTITISKLKSINLPIVFQCLPFKQLLQLRLVNRFFNQRVQQYFPEYRLRVNKMLDQCNQSLLDQEVLVDQIYEQEGSAQEYFASVQITKQSIEQLTKQMVAELKSFQNPPKEVIEIVKVLSSFLSCDSDSWTNARKCLSILNLSQKLIDLNIHEVPYEIVAQVKLLEEYNLEQINVVSVCAHHFLIYLRGILVIHSNEYFKSLVVLNKHKRNLAQVIRIDKFLTKVIK